MVFLTLITGILWAFVTCSVSSKDLHTGFSDSESIETFVKLIPVKRSSDEPEYHISVKLNDEVRQYHLRKARSAFSKDFKVYHDVKDLEGKPRLAVRNEGNFIKDIYTTEKRDAALHVFHNGKYVEIEGYLDLNLRIAPVTGDHHMKRSSDGILHRVYRDSLISETLSKSVSIETITSDLEDNRNRRDTPSELYPELFIVYDYYSTKAFNNDLNAIKNYLGIFVTLASGWFERLKYIKVSITTVGLFTITNLSFQQSCYTGTQNVDGLKSFGKCVYANFRNSKYPNFDIAILLTGLTAFSANTYTSGLCSNNTYDKVDYSSTIIKDAPNGFTGVSSMVRGISTVLGLSSDGNRGPEIGEPSAESCSFNSGYVMGSTSSNNLNSLSFSKCSEDQLIWVSQNKISNCLKNKPSASYLSRINTLPGSTVTPDNQCKSIFGPDAKYEAINICEQFRCMGSDNRYISKPALDGTVCGQNQICVRGVCTKK